MARRRLIICCDGTQNDDINTSKPPTNVARVKQCVHVEDRRNTVNNDDAGASIHQFTYYKAGVGTGTSQFTNAYDSIMGEGIENNIRDAYNYLCSNYTNETDEIILIGFSRGAFTVRALAFLIDQVGLLKKEGLPLFHKIFETWSKQSRKNADKNDALKSILEDVDWSESRHHPVSIKACAVWDTVAALRRGRLEFVDETIPACVERAIHAIALNEQRSQFEPLLFGRPREGQTLQQCWFLGSHSDVGGGNEKQGLANISLAWMMAQLQDLIHFDPSTIKRITTHSNRSSEAIKAEFLHDSSTGQPPMFELEVTVPVQEFQAKSDIQVEIFAKLQRLVGWKHRKPFDSALQTEQTLHWTVPILLEKQCVSKCVPLQEFDCTTEISQDRAVEGVSRDNPSLSNGAGSAVRPKHEPSSLFEKSVLANWIIEESLQAVYEAERSDQGDREATIDAVKMIPIYAVLWEPELWSIEESIKLGKQIYLGFRHGSQMKFQTPKHATTIENWRHEEESSKSFAIRAWLPGHNSAISGLPFYGSNQLSVGVGGETFFTLEWHKTCKVLTGKINVPVADTRVPSDQERTGYGPTSKNLLLADDPSAAELAATLDGIYPSMRQEDDT